MTATLFFRWSFESSFTSECATRNNPTPVAAHPNTVLKAESGVFVLIGLKVTIVEQGMALHHSRAREFLPTSLLKQAGAKQYRDDKEGQEYEEQNLRY
jgi:hypothetical protein